jgi:excisionase family DNA binding protein
MFDRVRFYSASEVKQLSHAPRELVYGDLKSGRLKAYRRGRRWLIPGASVIEWLASTAEGGDTHDDR